MGLSNNTVINTQRWRSGCRSAQIRVAYSSVVVSADVLGPVYFPKNLVWAWVDSGQAVDETDETNNLAHSGGDGGPVDPADEFQAELEWYRDSFVEAPHAVSEH